jgi:hypothetical protein
VADVCGLHKPEQGMLKGSFPSSFYRLGRRPHCRVRALEFSGRLVGLPPDTPRRGGPACRHVHHSLQMFLLCKNVVWTKECGGYLPAVYAVLFQGTNQAQPGGLC